jgi:peptidoglycan/xylan/chitin deacetylase (PgdA/CDA1 family)
MTTRRLLSRALAGLRPGQPRPVILMYHRVARVRHDPWGIAVDPEHFEDQIAYLKEHRTAMSMDEFVRRIRSKTLPPDAVAITFDDGYRDNLINAMPVLVRHGVPASLFLPTGYIDRNEPFWWDELAAMILGSTHAANWDQVCGDQVITLCWPAAGRSEATGGGWRAWEKPRTARQSAYVTIWHRLQRAAEEERDRVMDSLRSRFEAALDPLAMAMCAEEIRVLLKCGLIAVGAHSVTHPALTALSRLESRREIALSGEQCRRLTAQRVDGFAYPYGDMSLEVLDDVVETGFSWACSTRHAFIDYDQVDIYALPRVAVPNSSIRTSTR